jgi:capsid protein
MLEKISAFGKKLTAKLSSGPRRSLASKPVHTRAAYDSAKTTTENSRHWQNAGQFGLTPDQINNLAVRNTLKLRNRYEYNNGGYTKRIINKTSNEVVGKHIKINVESSNEEFNQAVEKDLVKWMRLINLEKSLRTLVKDKMRDGEALAMPYTNNSLRHAVKLDLARFSCDRLTSPNYTMVDNNIDGVILDDLGINPIKYQITKYSSSQTTFMTNEYTEYPAEDIYHWFDQEYSEQHRGIPAFTSTLDIHAARRAYSKAVLSTAQLQANFAMVLEQQVVPGDDDTAIEEMTEFDVERNMVTALPPGAKLETVDASQPVDTFKDYNAEMIMEQSAPGNMPHNMVKGSSSDMNFSSARFDYYIMFGKDRDIIRSEMETAILDDFIMRYINDWVLLNFVQFPMGVPDDISLSYGYEVDKYINPLQESKADALRIEKNADGMSLQSLKTFYASQGKDYKEEIVQQAKEKLFQIETNKEILGEYYESPQSNQEPSTDESPTT